MLLVTIGLALCPLHCGTGGGLDIGNPTKICVVDSLDRPVANASVKLIPSGDWFASVFSGKPVVMDSAETDDAGIARFRPTRAKTVNVQVDHPSGAAFIRNVSCERPETLTGVTIGNYGSMSGTIYGFSGNPARIRLEGTAYTAPIAAEGTYTLPCIPGGVYSPVVMADDSRWNMGASVEVISSSAGTVYDDEISFSTFLIDDFEDTAHTGRPFVDDRRLYTLHYDIDSAFSGYSIVPEGADGGNALKGVLVTRGAWALVGYRLGTKSDGDSLWDFGSATGISFDVKGGGTLNISFESDTIDRMGEYKHYSADVELQPGWRHLFIPFDSLGFKKDSNPDPDITWEETAHSIVRIEFNALEDDTVEFVLDNLTVEGATFSEVY